jgi:hypothetical protein
MKCIRQVQQGQAIIYDVLGEKISEILLKILVSFFEAELSVGRERMSETERERAKEMDR